MSTAGRPSPLQSDAIEATESSPQTSTASESPERKPWAEITCAVVLALATMASAWCAYQASRWNGVQTFRLAEANEAGRQAATNSIHAMQIRAFDGTMFLQYLEARAQGQKVLETLLSARFRPEMKVAMDAWLETDPFNNAGAPSHPFKMAEFKIAEETAAARQSQLQQELLTAAQEANRAADAYVLLTVVFASVLFFGGIAGTVHLAWLRLGLAAIAIGFLAATAVYLATMPVCRE
jgi:hypothetical protein